MILATREPITWFDQRPSHTPRPPALADAYRIMIDAWDAHKYACELVEMTLDDDARADFIAAEKVQLDKALEARRYYLELYNESQKVAACTINLDEEDI